MKKSILFPCAALLAAAPMLGAQAQEVGRVLSTTAIISQVSVPRQVCTQEQVQIQNQVPSSKSGAGAVMGGLAGGALGNAAGQGSGRAALTILGVFGGAILGDKIEGGNPAQVATTQQTVNRCTTQNFLENRTTGYQVVYEYAGKQYSVQLPQDPGPSIQLQVTPVAPAAPGFGAGRPVTSAPLYQNAPVAQAPQVIPTISSGVIYQPYVEPAVVYATPVVSTVVVAPTYYRSYYPAPVISTSFVYRGGHGYHHGHHGHRGYYR